MEQLTKALCQEELQIMKKLAGEMQVETKLSQYQGYKIIPNFSVECIKYANENFNIRKGDVFLASYPKTGTNWMSEILRRILFQDEESYKLIESLPGMTQFIEMGQDPTVKFSLLDELPLSRRMFATHLPPQLLNINKIKQANAKVVYVLRNPKDQIVSWYKFAQCVPFAKVEPMKSMLCSGWEKYLEHILACDFPMNTRLGEWYPDNILSWYAHKDDKTVMFVYYEDLKQDLAGKIKLVANFLEAPMTDAKAEEIAGACSFSNMKKNITNDNTLHGKLRSINMRKGEVGGWKDYFTVSQSERIDAIMNDKLSLTDIKFKYRL